MTKKPNFICVGATKAGTSWLFDRLNELSVTEMPLYKEIGYFDRHTKWTFEKSPLSEEKLSKRILDWSWTKKAVYNTAVRAISNPKSFKFWSHWYFSNYDDKWYVKLFSSQKISGDITPSYALLDEADFIKMREINPDVKIIYLIRNPIDRDWSQYRMMKSNLPDEEIIRYMEREDTEKRSDYLGNLKRICNVFPTDQVLIGFYDAVIDNPIGLIREIMSFVGQPVDDKTIQNECKIKAYSNKGRIESIPETVLTYLQEKYKTVNTHYAKLFGSYAKSWIGQDISDLEKKPTIIFSDVNPNL
jgi:hypothetical protein